MHASMSVFLNMSSRDQTLGLHSKPFHLPGHPLPSDVFSSSYVRWVQELIEHMSVLHETVREHSISVDTDSYAGFLNHGSYLLKHFKMRNKSSIIHSVNHTYMILLMQGQDRKKMMCTNNG